jgi:hypothetical protein
LLAAALLLLAPAAATAAPIPPLPQVDVRLDEVPPVDVNKETSTDIVVNGSVNITGVPAVVAVSVALNVSVLSSYWPATITPQRENLTGSGDVPFTVTVTVPPRAPADSATTLQVVANVSAYGVGRDFTGDTPIPIVQFYNVELDPAVPNTQPARFDAQAGGETSFSFRLRNTGNGRDSFEVRVTNSAELQGLGITTDLSSPITGVASGVTVVVTGSVSLPATLALGDYGLALEALSTGAVSSGTQAVGTAQKTIHAIAADPGPGNGNGNGGGGGNGNDTGEKPSGGFLPAPGAMAAVGALAAVAVACAVGRRPRRP